MNFDGAFGCRPGSESHSGQVLSRFDLFLINIIQKCYSFRFFFLRFSEIQDNLTQNSDFFLL